MMAETDITFHEQQARQDVRMTVQPLRYILPAHLSIFSLSKQTAEDQEISS